MLKLTILLVVTIVFEGAESLTDCENRQTTGLICEQCQILSQCVLIDSNWTSVALETCDSTGLFCNLKEKNCSSSAGACNQVGHNPDFKCQGVGIFPNPYDCQQYQICYKDPSDAKKLIAIKNTCQGSSAFSPKTGDCAMRTSDDVCKKPQFTCNSVGDIGAWPGNSNIFYICLSEKKVLYPIIYRCPPNQIFNGEICAGDGITTPTTTISPTAPTTAPTTPSSSSSSTTPSTGGSTLPPNTFTCSSRGYFADPDNCRFYYKCDSSLVATRLECPQFTYFSKITNSCVRGSC